MSDNNVHVRVIAGDGQTFERTFDATCVDAECAVCDVLHSGMNTLTGDKFYCNDCFHKMGMRHVRFGVYAHTAPDTLLRSYTSVHRRASNST